MPKQDFSFTKLQILTAIAHWKLEPLSIEELNALLYHFLPVDYPNDNCSYSYGQDDIESFILETLSDITE